MTGDLVNVSDSAAGSFVGVYDADGQLVSSALPGGITKTFTFDTTRTPTSLSYKRSDGTLIYQNSGIENAHGQYTGLLDDTFGQDSTSQILDYDAAGRLTRVQDSRTNSGTTYCTQREYTLDANSNRTSKAVRPETPGQCASSGGVTRNDTYEAADRLTSSG